MTVTKISFEWTDDKVRRILNNVGIELKFLCAMDSHALFEAGRAYGFFQGQNPFKTYTQKKLKEAGR